jgi:subtilisin family serine protease
MPTALGVLAATAVATFLNTGPASPPPAIVQMRDGTKLEVPVARPPSASQRFIVEFRERPRMSRATVERFRGDLARLRREKIGSEAVAIRHEYVRAFHGVSVTLDAASVDAVRRLAYVKRVTEDAPVQAFSTDEGHLTRIGADRMWSERNVRGDGVVVAVIDTGIDYRHPSLGGGIGAGFKVIAGYDFVDNDDDPMDEHGHGTHVAGIIAGGDDEVRGVAPNAKLIAYRVLNAFGSGQTSDILAAIEWTVDPNQDGDFSDHASVANMSLGGGGDADSPLSQSVDNATRLGVVFCLAAGNTPGERTIGSPGSSRLGITVGSSEESDTLAWYSSRGPSAPGWDLKPEMVAPGSLIRSAKLGGGTLVASGTSMAAPHVAGAAALLLQLHPGWSPADVKAALVGSAHPIVENVMGQGGGRIDIPAAASMGGAIAPAVVTFGRYGGKDAWTSARTVRITNHGATEETFAASVLSPEGVVITAEPAELTLAPGASRDVLLSASISAEAGAALQTLAHGGRVTFTSAHDAVQVPWVAVDAALVKVTHELPSSLLWACDSGVPMTQIVGGTAFDVLLPNSRCDLLTLAVPFGLGGATLISRSLVVDDDLDLAFTAADAMLELRLGGVDQNGKPISSVGFSLETPFSSAYDIHFPPGSKFQAMILQMLSSEPLRTSDLPEDFTLTVSEMLFDFPRRSIYAIDHPALHGVHESMTLSSLPSDLRHGRVTVAPQAPGTTLHAMMGYMSQGYLGVSGFNPSATLENGWSGDLYLTPAASPDSWGAVALHTGRLGEGVWLDWRTPMFRVAGDQIVASNDPVPSPAAYRVAEGGTIAAGEAPLHPETFVETNGTAFRILPALIGPVAEFAYDATAGFTYELRDGAGALLREGTSDDHSITADFGSVGVYRANLRMKTGQHISLVFDTSHPSFNPPSLTSLRVVDGEGHAVSRVARGTPLTLQFSVVDADASGNFRDSTDPRTTRASWRVAGKEWHELPLTVALIDRGQPSELGHYETGIHYRADLGPVTAAIANRIELRIELEDAGGNSSTSIFDYPLTVQRTRAVGK